MNDQMGDLQQVVINANTMLDEKVQIARQPQQLAVRYLTKMAGVLP